MEQVHFKGVMYNLDNVEFYLWDENPSGISLCCNGDIAELKKQVDVESIITEKVTLLRSLKKESVYQFVENETGETIAYLTASRIIFDFAEPEDGVCSLDLYLYPGKIFGGFNVHLRLHGSDPRIEMCGLSL